MQVDYGFVVHCWYFSHDSLMYCQNQPPAIYAILAGTTQKSVPDTIKPWMKKPPECASED